ncbi:hypothetical protein MKZ38_001911 [Zalerion maritima]|uniref:Uncharacterized protein n=1 Tax=Zalerion maritima TaxID=339359 RepID=A0AAD5RR98_9PEZI|nr:hypothetical protein MKZ38_001911 [Zalerion maritima]
MRTKDTPAIPRDWKETAGCPSIQLFHIIWRGRLPVRMNLDDASELRLGSKASPAARNQELDKSCQTFLPPPAETSTFVDTSTHTFASFLRSSMMIPPII